MKCGWCAPPGTTLASCSPVATDTILDPNLVSYAKIEIYNFMIPKYTISYIVSVKGEMIVGKGLSKLRSVLSILVFWQDHLFGGASFSICTSFAVRIWSRVRKCVFGICFFFRRNINTDERCYKRLFEWNQITVKTDTPQIMKKQNEENLFSVFLINHALL